jgi:hypothetical protein
MNTTMNTGMNTGIPRGVQGCYCEDCSGNRAGVSTEPATPQRRMLSRWARRGQLRVRLASDVLLRRES